jgi:hypothetical protein
MTKHLLKVTAITASLFIANSVAAENVATFEDFIIPSGNYWKGNFMTADTLIKSGDYLFTNHSEMMYGGTWAYGSEFCISKQTDTSCSWVYNGDEFNSASGSGVNGSAQFAVAFIDNNYNLCRAYMSDTVKGTSITGCYINNTSYVAEAAKGNDTYEGEFKTGDWFMLTATAKKANGTTMKDSLYLIDFRSSIESEHTYLAKWKWFNFSKFGDDVKFITFTVSGTHKNSYGLLTPTYFCMDDFGAQTPTDIQETNNVDGLKDIISISYYTIDGKYISKMEKGINIIVTRYSDGTSSTKKLIEK